MILRSLNLPKNHSFFLFGARGTGKTTLLKEVFKNSDCLWLNLLKPEEEDRFARSPGLLRELVKALPKETTHVILDEIQKVPKLLDVVHELVEDNESEQHFVLTGSSARKLKAGGANLLAGRAFVYHLFPFSELGDKFSLQEALTFGLLPKISSFSQENKIEKEEFLRSYATTYLKEEVWGEQIIRKRDPFRRFLEVAAQSNGKILNMSNISRDVGVDPKTVASYFGILEDTLLGFHLEAFKHSFRKRLSLSSKFYFFDTGVTRALSRTLSLELMPKTSAYGDSFEHLVIVECHKLISNFYPDYRMSYLRTKDDMEIDLVVERPGLPLLFIEIKSSDNIDLVNLNKFSRLVENIPNSEAICLCNEPRPRLVDNIRVLPWRTGLSELFLPV